MERGGGKENTKKRRKRKRFNYGTHREEQGLLEIGKGHAPLGNKMKAQKSLDNVGVCFKGTVSAQNKGRRGAWSIPPLYFCLLVRITIMIL